MLSLSDCGLIIVILREKEREDTIIICDPKTCALNDHILGNMPEVILLVFV